ncbi:MAG: hypothetical protein ACP6IQ_07525 [Candidatus Njordarchaeia archaeon]
MPRICWLVYGTKGNFEISKKRSSDKNELLWGFPINYESKKEVPLNDIILEKLGWLENKKQE